MIRTLLALIPADRRNKVGIYSVLTLVSVPPRVAGTVCWIPLVAALFGTEPRDALPWLAWLTAVTSPAGSSTPPPPGSIRSRVRRR